MSFNDFPDEILLRIFSFVSEKDLCVNCSLVCRRWHNLSSDKSLIKARARIQNGDDLISIFEDSCYNSDYLSFDYITDYVSENYHSLDVRAVNLWGPGWMKGVRGQDLRIIKRIDGYGIPHPTSSNSHGNLLFYLVQHGDMRIIKFLTAGQSYKENVLDNAILAAKVNKKLDIAKYLETLKSDS